MPKLPKSSGKKMVIGSIETEAEREVVKIVDELAAMPGVQVAVILSNPNGKQFCYGNIQSLIKKLISSNQVDQQIVNSYTEMYATSSSEPSPRVKQLKKKLKKANLELKRENKKGEKLEETLKKLKLNQINCIDSLGLDELMELQHKLEELKRSRPRGNGGPCAMDITEN